ncbi:hypothetical protein FOA52_008857 [Chlamydomonas sp. UWO 241]|nr:hypothetical protein FOA52_008857 [Chlamydomonas sp. UWO 241]
MSLSARFPREARCLLPAAWGVGALFLVFCAELAWSISAGAPWHLSPKPVLTEFFAQSGSKAVVVSLFQTAYRITAILLCTERGSASRRALSVCQAWVGVIACLLLTVMLEAQRAFPIDATLRNRMAVIATMECGAPLLLVLLTPKIGPAGARASKAASASDDLPTSPAAAHINTHVPASANVPGNHPSGTSAAAHSRADTALARAAMPVTPPTATTSDGAQLQYSSVLLIHSVPSKFPALHLADHPHLATPHGLAALRERLESRLSARASLRFGALVTLRFLELTVAAGCIVVHGRVRVEGCMVDEAEVEMIRSELASELLLELTPEGELVPDGDTAMMQLGPARLAQPLPLPGVPLLSATWPLLVLPHEGGGLVHMQFGLAVLARDLGNDPELVLSWAPSGAAAAQTPLFQARVATLQSAARSRGNPPGLINIDVDLGPRPSHGVLIAQLVDGNALLAVHSVAVLPASANAVVKELLCARLPANALHAVAHDLGVLLCGPRVRSADYATVSRRVVLALMAAESASHPALPALRALLGGLLRDLDAGDAKLEASPSSSSPVTTAADADAAADCPPYNRPPPLWCRAGFTIATVKVAGFLNEGEGVAALIMAVFGMPYGLCILADNTRVFSRLPRVLRGLDACAAGRIYRALLCIAVLASGINPIPRAPDHLKLGGVTSMLLAWSWFERPRSSAMGAAFALLVELPISSLFFWHALACCGQPTSASQALAELCLRTPLIIALHVAVWWAIPTPPAGTPASRATKLKVA